MPSEDRRIIFAPDEVYNALYALSVQKGMKKPPPGHVKMVSVNKDNSSEVVIKLEDIGHQETRTVEYTRDFLAAALMVFCRGAGIPLPKSAKKSVMINEGQVILRVEIG